jgi:adenine-specific DNA-methyltransferase
MGGYSLAEDHMAPWVLPRHYEDRGVAAMLSRFSTTLKDLGYQVSTGPLVWNRHKPQFRDHADESSLPVVWAESITSDGRFVLKAEKNNHQPHFKPRVKDGWLITNHPCILLQRTTAKEQDKRLMAAPLPKKLYKQGVVIENHLNMIIPIDNIPAVSTEVLAALLNSRGANRAFKCISGSVAVSAYELESMPLPGVDEVSYIQTLFNRKASSKEIEDACNQLYQL